MKKATHVLVEGPLNVAQSKHHGNTYVCGDVGGMPLGDVVAKARVLGIECGDHVRFIIEVDKPDVRWPTGENWSLHHHKTEAKFRHPARAGHPVLLSCWFDGEGNRRLTLHGSCQIDDIFRRAFGQADEWRREMGAFA